MRNQKKISPFVATDRAGFTLVELLMVITILAVLGGLGAGVSRFPAGRAGGYRPGGRRHNAG